MWPTLIFAATLVLLSALFLLWHVYDWGLAQSQALSDAEMTYQRQRYQRRTLASSLVGVSGILIGATEWIAEPLLLIGSWVALIAVLGWIVAIAAADWTATRRHFTQLRIEQQAEHTALREEIERFKREQARRGSNGH